MQFYKRLGDALKFIYHNPYVLALYLPLALLALIPSDYTSSMLATRTVLVMLLVLLVSTFVFAFSILSVYYYEHKRYFDFKSLSKLSLQRFMDLFIVQITLFLGISIFSTILDGFSILFTANIGQAFTIVFSLAFLCILIKLILAVPSSVIKEGRGFKESWNIVGSKEFLEIALLVIIYSLLSYWLSLLPFTSSLISFLNVLILSPILVVTLTFLYLDYSKKGN